MSCWICGEEATAAVDGRDYCPRCRQDAERRWAQFAAIVCGGGIASARALAGDAGEPS